MARTETNGRQQQGTGFSFQISVRDIGPLFRDSLRLPWNELSPFAKALAAYVPGTAQLGGDARALASHALFEKAASIAARPDVRLGHRYASGPSTGAFAAYCSRVHGEDAVAVVFPSADGAYLVRSFSSAAAYFSWWLNLLSSNADEPVGGSASTLSLEALLYRLHAVDAYRRARYQSMLSYGPAKAGCIPVTEFVESMAKSAASRDLQWLLPSFLSLTPGLGARKLEPRPVHLKTLADAGYVIPGRDSKTQEKIFYFGDVLEQLGSEFIGGMDSAVGLEIAVLTERGGLPVLEGFLAPTRVANHLIEIEPGANGAVIAKHKAMTQRELYGRFVGLLSGALHPDAPKVALRRALLTARVTPRPEKQQRAEAAEIVCADCGQANPVKMKFCGECGGRLVRETATSGKQPATRPAPPSKSARTKRQRTRSGPTVRQWFRMTPRRWFPEIASVERKHVEDLARLVRLLREKKLVAEPELKALHAALRLKGPGPNPWKPGIWTVGLGSLRWSRFDRGAWVPDNPPELVYLDAALLRAIAEQKLSQSSARLLHVPAARAQAPAAAGKRERSCPSCRKPLPRQSRFCSFCGANISQDARETSRKPAAGRSRRAQSKDAKTAARRCPNAQCGGTVAAGKKFCTACGTRVE
jgi:hypothetical protein